MSEMIGHQHAWRIVQIRRRYACTRCGYTTTLLAQPPGQSRVWRTCRGKHCTFQQHAFELATPLDANKQLLYRCQSCGRLYYGGSSRFNPSPDDQEERCNPNI